MNFEKLRNNILPEKKSSNHEKKEEIKFSEIRELYEPARKILAEIRESVEKGEYAAVLGDDASGRLPALLFWRVLKNVYKEKGFNSPKVLFFAGQYGTLQEDMIKKLFPDFINKTNLKEISKEKKVLIVTDTISSGNHILPYASVLKKFGIDFDVVTIGNTGGGGIDNLQKLLGVRVFYGEIGTPKIYKKEYLSGVMKRGKPSIFAEAWPKQPKEPKRRSDLLERISRTQMIWEEEMEKRKEIAVFYKTRRQARYDIENLAQNLIEDFYNQNK